jgi:hypothetical protein
VNYKRSSRAQCGRRIESHRAPWSPAERALKAANRGAVDVPAPADWGAALMTAASRSRRRTRDRRAGLDRLAATQALGPVPCGGSAGTTTSARCPCAPIALAIVRALPCAGPVYRRERSSTVDPTQFLLPLQPGTGSRRIDHTSTRIARTGCPVARPRAQA